MTEVHSSRKFVLFDQPIEQPFGCRHRGRQLVVAMRQNQNCRGKQGHMRSQSTTAVRTTGTALHPPNFFFSKCASETSAIIELLPECLGSQGVERGKRRHALHVTYTLETGAKDVRMRKCFVCETAGR